MQGSFETAGSEAAALLEIEKSSPFPPEDDFSRNGPDATVRPSNSFGAPGEENESSGHWPRRSDMVKRSAIGLILGCLLILSAGSAFAGGYQEVTDITNVPTSIPGTVYANYVPLHWDDRCIPVTFRMNNTLDPIPNPLGAAFLSYANAKAAIQSAANSWNAIPTSYIQFNFGPDVANAGNRKFDMINEITFRTGPAFNFFASFFPVRLAATSTLNNGDDLDGDGDSDVSSSITQCTDFDGDGDIEFPAGTYDAGTIIELDIAFNTKSVPPAPAGSMGVRWTVTDDIPTLT